MQQTISITSETRQWERILLIALYVCLFVHWSAMIWGAAAGSKSRLPRRRAAPA